jgi:hypothetical protein
LTFRVAREPIDCTGTDCVQRTEHGVPSLPGIARQVKRVVQPEPVPQLVDERHVRVERPVVGLKIAGDRVRGESAQGDKDDVDLWCWRYVRVSVGNREGVANDKAVVLGKGLEGCRQVREPPTALPSPHVAHVHVERVGPLPPEPSLVLELCGLQRTPRREVNRTKRDEKQAG